MSFHAPDWLLATDRELVEQFVESRRQEVRELFAAVERMDSSHAFGRVRWKLVGMIREAQINAAELAKSAPQSTETSR